MNISLSKYIAKDQRRKAFFTLHSSLFTSLLILSAMTASCTKDGDIVTAQRPSAAVIDGSCLGTLDEHNTNALAMTLHWTDNTAGRLETNYSDVLLPLNACKNKLQVSDSENFASYDETVVNDGVSQMQFTARLLNEITARLQLTPYEQHDIYVRMATSTGDNIEPVYSNTLHFNVTPYKIYLNQAHVIDANGNDTGLFLYSPDEDGHYEGFHKTPSGWYNMFLRENDGTLWYTEPNKAFEVTKTPDWKLWYPEFAGCYYTTFDTQSKQWTALYIPSLTVSGDISGDMKLDPLEAKWTMTFTPETAGQKTITISCPEAKFFDKSSRDATDKAQTKSIYMNPDQGISYESAQVSLNVEQAGTPQTLVIDFSDNVNGLSYTIEEGGQETHDLLSAAGFNNQWDPIDLTEIENTGIYYGEVTASAECEWGVQILKNGSWDSYYGLSADGHTLLDGSKDNGTPSASVWQEGQTYYIVIDVNKMEYLLTPKVEISYAGFNDDWTVTPMHPTATQGTYVAYVNATAENKWGVQFLVNGSWSEYYGTQPDGVLTSGWKADGTPDATMWQPGSRYKVTIDTVNLTYSIEKP